LNRLPLKTLRGNLNGLRKLYTKHE
jgi:hypothetical protein